MVEISDAQIIGETKNKAPNKFHFSPKRKIVKGFLFRMFREVWLLQPNGTSLQLVLFYISFFIVLLPLAFVFDVIAIVSAAIYFSLKTIAVGIWNLILKIVEKLFSKLVFPAIKTTLIIAVVITLAIILIYRFELIKEFILNLYDTIL